MSARQTVLGLAITELVLQIVGLIISIIDVIIGVGLLNLIFNIIGIIASLLCIVGSRNLNDKLLIVGAVLNFVMAAVDIALFLVVIFVIRFSTASVLVVALIYGIAIAFFICCGVYALKLRKLVFQEK